MSWEPLGEVTEIGGGTRQYLRSTHSHEGGHEARIGDMTVRALPDGRTTPRQRSHAISEALHTVADLQGAVFKLEGMEEPVEFDPVAYLVGLLILEGCRNLEVDGEAVFDRTETVGQWRLDLAGDGKVSATWLGADA